MDRFHAVILKRESTLINVHNSNTTMKDKPQGNKLI